MHTIKDCCRAREAWDVLFPSEKATQFYSLVRREWVLWLLKEGNVGGSSARRSERLLLACWLQWRWRNLEVFEDTRLDSQQRLRQVVCCF